jgi:dephospho-CoA kinase
MIKVGVTGGIGSGKSYVSKVFEQMGIPVFYADIVAKNITTSSVDVIQEIKNEFGNEAYNDQVLNRVYLAKIVFKDPEKLEKLNKIIHPAVKTEFVKWCNSFPHKPYVIEEAAILFESGSYKQMDRTIVVSAPEALRIKRVTKRDKLSEQEVHNRMKNQWPTEKIEGLADFIINNDGKHLLLPQIIEIDKTLRR